MPYLLGLVLLGLPALEIALFIWVGGAIGVAPTLALTVLSTIAGAALARFEGLATWRALEESLARAQPPVKEAVSGALVLLAGILLALPGFFTDILGLLLLIRPLRGLLSARAVGYFAGRPSASFRTRNGPPIVDGTAIEIDPRPGR